MKIKMLTQWQYTIFCVGHNSQYQYTILVLVIILYIPLITEDNLIVVALILHPGEEYAWWVKEDFPLNFLMSWNIISNLNFLKPFPQF